jgi:Plasmid encoded RepA protein
MESLMGTVHDLLEVKGKQGALEAGIERSVVEAAVQYLTDEDNALSFAYSGWAQCALPHKRLADDATWGISAERIKLMVEPGRRPVGNGTSSEFVGVPFGSHARLILLYLQTEALRTGKREVELGGSLREWLGRIGVSVGGMTGRSVRDQAERISRCRLTFHLNTGGKTSGLVNQSIVDRALFIEESDRSRQGRLTLETAKLSEGFFDQLKKHPVPLEEAAIKALSNNAPALDCYLWLSYRLHAIHSERLVTWQALKGQFGTAFKELYHFKPRFTGTLTLATAVYPGARVEVTQAGVILKPSRPPVAPKLVAVR